MASKNKATQSELIKAFMAAGYALDGVENRPGHTLVVRLTPPTFIEHDQFEALRICDAMGLQAQCRIFPQVPSAILIVTVQLPEPIAASTPKPDIT